MTKKPSNVDANDELYHRIQHGGASAIAEMIERNIPLVTSRVGVFIQSYRRFSHLRDDLVSEGLLALTKTVNGFTEGETEKPTGRIVFEIDKALGDFIDREVGSGIMSDRTVRRRRSKNLPLPNKLPLDVNSPPANLWFQSDGRVIQKLIVTPTGGNQADVDREFAPTPIKGVASTDARQFVRDISHTDNSAENDLLETIYAGCACDEDRMIVELRIKGYTDAEIGEQMGLSQQVVNIRRHEIEQRFNERMAQ